MNPANTICFSVSTNKLVSPDRSADFPVRVKYICLHLCLCLFTACGTPAQEKQAKSQLSVQEIPVPAREGSVAPNLFVTEDEQLYMSWIEPENDSGHVLRFSTLENGKWVTPKTIAQGNNWFVNWADFPSLAVGADGTITAHWLVKRTSETYDYDVYVSQSSDQGDTWKQPFILHTDGVAAEHGFVSMVTLPDNQIFATWLDGRNTKNEAPDEHGMGPMSLRAARMDTEGKIYDALELDEKVCDCCQTDAALTAEGLVVVYRNRSDNEIRDIYLMREVNRQWTDPAPVHDDGWEIAGCPVNGPAVDAYGQHVAVAWFTGAHEQPKVQLAFSKDAGATFSPPIHIDHGDPLGRVDVVVLEDASAWINWMEGTPEGATIMAVHVSEEGTKLVTQTIASTNPSRASGFPVMEKAGNQLYFAWTQADSVSGLRTAYLSLKE